MNTHARTKSQKKSCLSVYKKRGVFCRKKEKTKRNEIRRRVIFWPAFSNSFSLPKPATWRGRTQQDCRGEKAALSFSFFSKRRHHLGVGTALRLILFHACPLLPPPPAKTVRTAPSPVTRPARTGIFRSSPTSRATVSVMIDSPETNNS